jgi:hypothetical protein
MIKAGNTDKAALSLEEAKPPDSAFPVTDWERENEKETGNEKNLSLSLIRRGMPDRAG